MTDFAPLPLQPHDADGPVFREPWEAQAFALAVRLSEIGVFSWSEWAETLGAEIKAAQVAGDRDLGDTYYRHWVKALERLVAEKRILGPEAIGERTEDWRRAYRATPHGKPVELSAAHRKGR